MNYVTEIFLKAARRLISAKTTSERHCIDDARQAHRRISELLESSSPCMIARFGSTELNALLNYRSVKNKPSLWDYLSGKSYQWWWNEKGIYQMKNNAGFFPNDIASVEKFCELMISDAKQVDFLGSWLQNEDTFCPHLTDNDKTLLRFLEPYWSDNPWTKSLEGKKILVVHPFAELIESQYHNNRDKLFVNKDILPEFNLITVKAVQSIGGKCEDFKSWFDALKWMEDEIDSKDYDIALIGCGAYGFPLAAHIKRMGKKAVHLGGALQLLFGIIGNRWEDPMYGVREWGIPQGFYSSMINEFWVRPGDVFKPENAESVEGACYW